MDTATTKVWDPLVRISHWMLAAAFFFNYLTEGEVMPAHAFAGYGIGAIRIDPAKALLGLFGAYGISGYLVYVWRRYKGQPTSVISTSTDEPDEVGLHDQP